MEECAVAESFQESGIVIDPHHLELRAKVRIHQRVPLWELHVYRVRKWSSNPVESGEHGPPK